MHCWHMSTPRMLRFAFFWAATAAALSVPAHLCAAQQIPPPPEIVSRAAWGASPPDVALMKAQKALGIIIHHTAERQQPQHTLEEKLLKLQRFSRTKGTVGTQPKPAWGDVPYHFYIDAAGRIGEGRNVGYAGDTNTEYETANRIQIALEGHFDLEQPTAAQLGALDRLVIWLAAKHRIPATRLSGHSDHVATTACPGRHLKSYLPRLRRKAAGASIVR